MISTLFNLVAMRDNFGLHFHVDSLGIYIYSTDNYSSRMVTWDYLQDFLIAGTADEVVINAVKDLVKKKGNSIYAQ